MLSIAILAFLCLLTHEAAHALAALCCGGGIREFVLLSLTPHIRVSGVFTLSQNSWICAAGSAGELLLFLLAVIAAPSTRGGRLAIEVTGVFASIELIGWALSAFAFPNGPRDTDVWKFLTSSGFHPAFVVAGCCVAAIIIFFAYRARVPARP